MERVPLPRIMKNTQVLIKVRAACICGSDLHALMVPPAQVIQPGIITGHEFFGEIVQCSKDVAGFATGDLVVVNPAIPCGTCVVCRDGRGDICNEVAHYGQNCDGGFAQYAVVESSQLYKVPDDLNPLIAAQAEPVTCIMGGISKLKPTEKDFVLLYGAGPIGLTFIKILKSLGVAHLAVCAKGRERMKVAEKFGAELVIDPQTEQVGEKISQMWGRQPNVIIDAVGTGAVFEEAVSLRCGGGRILLFGYNLKAVSRVFPGQFCEKELTVMGTRTKDFRAALSILNDERLRLDELVSHKFTLKDIEQGIELIRSRKACKVVLFPNGEY